MNVHEKLCRMRELLADPSAWTQDANARDVDGRAVDVNDSSAVCWCLSGAARAVTERGTCAYLDVCKTLAETADYVHTYEIVSWNDTPGRTHAQVIALINQAIEDTK